MNFYSVEYCMEEDAKHPYGLEHHVRRQEHVNKIRNSFLVLGDYQSFTKWNNYYQALQIKIDELKKWEVDNGYLEQPKYEVYPDG